MYWYQQVRQRRPSDIVSIFEYVSGVCSLVSQLDGPMVCLCVYQALTPGPMVRLGTRSAVSPLAVTEMHPQILHIHKPAWSCVPGFMCWVSAAREQRWGAEAGTLPKGRRVLQSRQDAASSFLSLCLSGNDGESDGGRLSDVSWAMETRGSL